MQANNVAHRFGGLKRSMFENADDFPRLKGAANELRHFGAPLAHVFNLHCDNTVEIQRHMKMGLKATVDMENIMSVWSAVYRWPRNVHREFDRNAIKFCLVQTALGEHFHPLRIALFHFTIKSHYLLHIALASLYINPRLGWCYSGEDMMGKVKHLIQGTYRGTPVHVLVSKTMRKYANGLAFDMSRFV